MQISFDPYDTQDAETVRKVLDLVYGGEPVAVPTEEPTVTVNTDTPVAVPSPVSPTPTTDSSETDIHGMLWNDTIHSTPATKNADGSWRAKRGAKPEYDAAIAAHKAGQTASAGAAMVPEQAPAGSAMPMPGMPSPAAPVPQTPAEPISYQDMSVRFLGMMESGQIGNYEQVYAELGIDYSQVETNQTMITKLSKYMDALTAGADHANAVAAANAG